MPTTPNLALPYPDDEEWLQAGAPAIEALATSLDNQLHFHYMGVNPADVAPVAVPVGGYVNLLEYTWDGPAGWVLMVTGGVIESGVNPSAKTGRLLQKGGVVGTTTTVSESGGMSMCRIGHLDPGDVITLQAAGGTVASTAGGYWLQVLRLAVGP